jgi:8-oxo-dGTP diphosphatase
MFLTANNMKIRVCCAIIINEDKILVAQRTLKQSNSLKWEFPGGKVEPDETEEECIKREILEELAVEIKIKSKLQAVFHSYPDFQIELIPLVCEIINGQITCREHKKIDWFNYNVISELDLADADKKVWQLLLKSKKQLVIN